MFQDRYALKDPTGKLLEDDPKQMWRRVAEVFGQTKFEKEEFFSILSDFQFVPSGRILAGAGSGTTSTYYNCFVIGIKSNNPDLGNDSRQGIMDTLSNMIEITARGGGVGMNWSTLRPSGSFIKGVQGNSSGSNSWMKGADGLADQIRQGGSRTAALMFMLDDWHPDVMEFASAERPFLRANFSVTVSDRFMKVLSEDGDWTFLFPDTTHPMYNTEWDGNLERWVESGLPVIDHGTVKASLLWNMICEGAYKNGSPGLVFLEKCNKESNTWYVENLICMNPCGEQSLPAGGSCNLGSINLTSFWDPVRQDINWTELDKVVRSSIKFLDNVITLSKGINEEIGDIQRNVRRIGLGTMGLADILILKQLRYGSDESLTFIGELYTFIRDCAYDESVNLAKRLGPAPALNKDLYLKGSFVKTLPNHIKAKIRKFGIRNLQLLTQAPTGTTGILAGASSGIEPIFSDKYLRRDATGEHVVVHPLFEGERKDYHVTANDVSGFEHILVQSTIQRLIDSSISKTINMHRDSTVKDISDAYQKAYALGCKGITIYRNGSLEDVLVTQEEAEACEACSL